MPKKHAIQPGDKVTCRLPVEAFYSNYGPNPKIPFNPGDVATVAAISPKVRICKGPEYDGKDEHIVADFHSAVTGKTERVCLNFCNAKKV